MVSTLVKEEKETITYELLSDFIMAAAEECNLTKTTRNVISKPWFDKACVDSRLRIKQIYKKALNEGWTDNMREHYKEEKNTFRSICRLKRAEYDTNFQHQLNNCKMSSDFWQAVKRYRAKPSLPNKVSKETWLNFYKNIMPTRALSHTLYEGNEVPEVECEISEGELLSALKKLKNNKSPGHDSITNEFLKGLENEGREALQNMFNDILQSESIPDPWAKSVTVMIYKKGCPNDPANYRPIALLNTMLKLFTNILQERLTVWAEKRNILPESQAGFRKNRSCEEQIFCLKTAIQKSLSKKKGKMFALFIDFERAFPSIPHEKLWSKLSSLGFPSKIIRLLKNLYDKSSTVIRSEHGNSPEIQVTLGLLQGEVLSPILFSLYIADIEKVLTESGIPGIKLLVNRHLHILLFADDMIVMASSQRDLQRKIDILRKYFLNLDLKVNLAKTKVIVFRKGGRLARGTEFTYGEEKIEIISQYTYLGVIFSQKGVVAKAAVDSKRKGIAALGSIWNVIFAGKIGSLSSKLRLFNSISASCSLYAAHIWSLRYINKLEEVQAYFIKRMLGIEKCTPNYLLRLESGVPSMLFRVIKQALCFWVRVMDIDPSRHAKQCLTALIKDWENNPTRNTYNWVGQLNHILQPFGFNNFVQQQDSAVTRALIPEILTRILDMTRQKYMGNMRISKRFSSFENIMNNLPGPSTYLNLNLPYNQLSIFAQCRLNRNIIYFEKFKHDFTTEEFCKPCNMREEGSFFHFITKCRINESERPNLVKSEGRALNSVIDLEWYFNPSHVSTCASIFKFVSHSLRVRQMIIEE